MTPTHVTRAGAAPRGAELSIVSPASAGSAVLLLAAFLSDAAVPGAAPGGTCAWIVMGIALAVLGWWAAALGRVAIWIYRGTMVVLVAAGADHASAPERAVLMMVGVLGTAFSWIPDTVATGAGGASVSTALLRRPKLIDHTSASSVATNHTRRDACESQRSV